jgi:hypothetical protein
MPRAVVVTNGVNRVPSICADKPVPQSSPRRRQRPSDFGADGDATTRRRCLVAMRPPEMTAMAAYTSNRSETSTRPWRESARREGATCAIRHGSSSSRHVVARGNRAFLFAGPVQSITRGSGYHEQIRCCYRDAERHSS